MKLKFLAACLAAASIFKPAFSAESEDFIAQGADAQLLATKYTVYNLGAVENGSSFARAVSSDGKAAGYVTFHILGGKRPAIFERNKLPAPIYTDGPGEATGINRLREVAGWFLQGTKRQGFVWKNNVIKVLLSPVGGHSHAAAINNNSVVVGWYEVSPGITHAFRYQNGVTTDLGTWGGRSAQATAINANGDIAGFREIFVNGALVKQGVRLRADGTRQIIKPLPGFDNLVPTEINDTGDLAGSMSVEASDFPFDAAAFIVKGATGTTVTRLTPAGCCFGSVGLSLNKSRKVVGYRFDRLADPSELGRLWDVSANQEISLYTLPEALAAGWWRLSQPSDINNNGVIVGQGAIRPASGGQLMRAFMLVPIPTLTSAQEAAQAQ
jgi:probable HAF family extracellular repeat protein